MYIMPKKRHVTSGKPYKPGDNCWIVTNKSYQLLGLLGNKWSLCNYTACTVLKIEQWRRLVVGGRVRSELTRRHNSDWRRVGPWVGGYCGDPIAIITSWLEDVIGIYGCWLTSAPLVSNELRERERERERAGGAAGDTGSCQVCPTSVWPEWTAQGYIVLYSWGWVASVVDGIHDWVLKTTGVFEERERVREKERMQGEACQCVWCVFVLL